MYVPGWFYVGSYDNNLRFISRRGEKTHRKGFEFKIINSDVNLRRLGLTRRKSALQSLINLMVLLENILMMLKR